MKNIVNNMLLFALIWIVLGAPTPVPVPGPDPVPDQPKDGILRVLVVEDHDARHPKIGATMLDAATRQMLDALATNTWRYCDDQDKFRTAPFIALHSNAVKALPSVAVSKDGRTKIYQINDPNNFSPAVIQQILTEWK